MLSVVSRNTSVQVPVENVITWMGFAPSAECSAFHARRTSGARQARKITGLMYFGFTIRCSEILLQVHSAVQRRHLVAVAVEHQRGTLEELADAALLRLAPARMVHIRVHVRVEPVFVRCCLRPGRDRLLIHQPDLYDRFDSLKAVLPRRNQADG